MSYKSKSQYGLEVNNEGINCSFEIIFDNPLKYIKEINETIDLAKSCEHTQLGETTLETMLYLQNTLIGIAEHNEKFLKNKLEETENSHHKFLVEKYKKEKELP